MTHEELYARHRAVLPAWLSLYYAEPIALVDGEGRHVVDAEGKRYLDFFGGILTTSVGYRIPEIVDAARAQMGRMVHTSTLYLIESQIELAEQIARRSRIPDAKVFFVNSGTEANEAALLFACAKRHSHAVVALVNSYHGRSFGAMSVTGAPSWSATSLSPLDAHFLDLSPHAGMTDTERIAEAVESFERILDAASADVAAFIFEPVQGVGGFVIPPAGVFAPLAAACARRGIAVVSDEVQTGWGRSGVPYWGIARHGVVPDAMTFAKGLANGLPIGGVVGRADLVDALQGRSISTFGGNPLSTTTALATLAYIDDHDLPGNAEARGGELIAGLADVAAVHEAIVDVRGQGLMVAVEFADPVAAGRALEEARVRGLLVGRGGDRQECLRIAPPMTVTTQEVGEAVAILADAISAAGDGS